MAIFLNLNILVIFFIFLVKLCRKPQQTIYFWNLLIDTVPKTYKTLKSNNFENLTYNANMFFKIDRRRGQKSFFRPEILHTCFIYILSQLRGLRLWDLWKVIIFAIFGQPYCTPITTDIMCFNPVWFRYMSETCI